MAENCSNSLDQDTFKPLRNLGATLHHVDDPDLMMETILTEARHFVRAEAGSIYTLEGGRLIFACSQNDYITQQNPNQKFISYKNQEISLNGNTPASFVARENVTLNIPDAYTIDLEKPYRFAAVSDHHTGYRTSSILTLPLTDMYGQVIGVLQLINRLDDRGQVRPFDADDEALMTIFSSTAAMALERGLIIRQMLLRNVRMAELRDSCETAQHAQRVGALSAALYREWAQKRPLDAAKVKSDLDHLRLAGMLHDIGKVGIPDVILNKPGRLTPDEHLEMEKHVLIGLRLFEPVVTELDAMIHEVILSHHERWDGRGYPGWVDLATGQPLSGRSGENGRAQGKKGEEISIFGRVSAVADAFDALISPRVYKEALDQDLVCQIMLQESGHHFDPELVEILLMNLDQAKAIRQRYPG